MSRARTTIEPRVELVVRSLEQGGTDASSVEEKLALLRSMREGSAEAAAQIDRLLIAQAVERRESLLETRRIQEKLKATLDKLAAPPWYPAVFLGGVETSRGPAALVAQGGVRLLVAIGEDVDLDGVAVGDEVLLGAGRNVVVARSPCPAPRTGETALFDRWIGPGRLVLRWRDEEVIVDAAGSLDGVELEPGDAVRWQRELRMVHEKIGRSKGEHLFLEGTPGETFEDVGGLDRQIDELQRALRLSVERPDLVRKYALDPVRAALLHGPPGTGKTLLARAVANWLSRLSSSGASRFMSIKPSALHSMWYAQTEANYREAFRIAREAAEREPAAPVVMFIDEVDSLGAARGLSSNGVDDRVLLAVMAELDGFVSRGNVFIIAATNRADVLDPALARPGRLGDLVLEIPRPGRAAARAIFSKHLRGDLPLVENGRQGSRDELIEGVLSRIYSPNGGAELATIGLRDGSRRKLVARELINGAMIAKIAADAKRRACRREMDSGPAGLSLDDLLAAADSELTRASALLTPANCRRHVSALPQDADVVSVEPIERRVRAPQRYIRLGA